MGNISIRLVHLQLTVVTIDLMIVVIDFAAVCNAELFHISFLFYYLGVAAMSILMIVLRLSLVEGCHSLSSHNSLLQHINITFESIHVVIV